MPKVDPKKQAPKTKAPAPKKEPTKAVAKVSPKGGALILSEDQAMVGGAKGYENVRAQDLMIPRLTILHQQSPQLLKSRPEFVKGAEVGDFCDTSTGDIFRESMEIIPVFFTTVYLEWAPRDSGRGLIRNHGINSDAFDAIEPDDKGRRFTEEGNYVQETATWYVLNVDADFRRSFIAMASTQLKASRKWNTAISQMRHETKDGKIVRPSMWYRSWKAVPLPQSNNQGDWNLWGFESGRRNFEIDPSGALWQECARYYEQASTGLMLNFDRGGGDDAQAGGGSSGDDEGDM